MAAYLLQTHDVLDEVGEERGNQDRRWGEQNHPDGTNRSSILDHQAAINARELADFAARHGFLTWRHILDEEVCEAFAEDDPAKLREELVQVAAVAVAWVEAIDRRAVGA